MSKLIGLREKKKASIKLNILNCTIDLMGTGFLNDLQVNDICEKAEISKVTFFKYFPQKEDVLNYFFQIWSFRMEVDQLRNPKKGIERIEYLFQKVGQSQNTSNIMLNLISYITHLKKPIKPIEITKAEKMLLYPDREGVLDLNTPSLGDVFIKCLQEAIEDGEIPYATNLDSIIKTLMTVFYGTPIVSHMKQENDLWKLYKENLNILFSGLKS